MEPNNARKAKELGMPHGTAANRLRKQIMFALLQRLGEDVCHCCGEIIATSEELSIEHVEPWLGVDPALFWDMDNIAFSHFKCNIGRRRPTVYFETNDGTAWCRVHQGYAPRDQFYPDRRRNSGINDTCIPCERKRKREAKRRSRNRA